ncbi:aspartate aminotransferase family protein [Streptomyces armeniacus]|uniref:Aspartate aminotransferase family protein n=1 Tax=Streptomyces armeniacus TaxID=83291 RepID=A0A345XU66_9ACTN|nr:pyridoxal-dependent decarboxylase [Streptomyces armeniacus]AXK35182.1 aspartate aminotransferase family protein [Streptomyces armeniacus]
MLCVSAVADSRLLAGGSQGAAALRPLVATVLDALADGAYDRCGPLPRGGPAAVAERVGAVVRGADGAGTGTGNGTGEGGGGVLPEEGVGADAALAALVRVLAEGAADPADPLCAAHLHCPPLAVAAAADLAASALNPSMDSWDQAPAASELESLTCAALAGLVYGADTGRAERRADALVTTGGTESNQLGVLLARELHGPGVRLVCGENAHHSVHRAAWLLGLAPPLVVPAPRGVLDPAALDGVLSGALESASSGAPGQRDGGRALVVATAGTTDAGEIDPLPEVADVAARHGVRLHVDAAYGGPLLFSGALRGRLAGLERADSVTLDLHKLGWQPVAAGLFVVPDAAALRPLDHRAEYLNADDDTEAGLPDLLGRSLRTTRRPDVLKVAVTLRALGRRGVAELVERTCAAARDLAGLVAADPGLELRSEPVLSTVLFRPAGRGDAVVAEVRRRLLAEGRAVLGRASLDGRLWLKVTLLNPHVQGSDLAALLKLVNDALADGPAGSASPLPHAEGTVRP